MGFAAGCFVIVLHLLLGLLFGALVSVNSIGLILPGHLAAVLVVVVDIAWVVYFVYVCLGMFVFDCEFACWLEIVYL